MSVVVSLPLFGEPGRELDENIQLTGKQLRLLGTTLHERLDKAAAILDTLLAANWMARTTLFDALLTHPQVATREQAETHLRQAGLDIEAFLIVEDVDEDTDLS